MDSAILTTGLLIFFARVCDVSMGTMRTISTVHGRSRVAFLLGLGEIVIWLLAASTVINRIHETPVLIAFYALGYATGNVVGINVEKRIAFGFLILRVITTEKGRTMADRLRKTGQAVTLFTGEGMLGPVTELYIVCRRRDLSWILKAVKEEDENAFYITEQASHVNKVTRPLTVPLTGWRAIFKKK